MLIITHGYLLHKEDYDEFDEIITFINEHGNKFKCISKGSRKILSKNNAHLNYGNYLEFEFFHSETKLSKLKKVHTLSYMPENIKLNLSLFLINEVYSQIEMDEKKWFILYQKLIFYILRDYNEYLIMLWLCVNVYKFSGLNIDFNSCYKCGGSLHIKSLELDSYRGVCNHCFNSKLNYEYDTDMIKLLEKIQNNQINIESIKINNIKKLIPLLKSLIIFVAKNSGIYIDTAKWF